MSISPMLQFPVNQFCSHCSALPFHLVDGIQYTPDSQTGAIQITRPCPRTPFPEAVCQALDLYLY